MDMSFIPNTKIALVRGVLSEGDCLTLVSGINSHRSLGMEFHFTEMTEESGRDFWRDKNTFLNDLGGVYQTILDNMEVKKEAAFTQYLLEIGDQEKYAYQKFAAAHSWDVGTSMYEHVDQYSGDSNIRYGFVLYLNSDFEGGEIYYPEYGIDVKPEPGLLVIHSGDIRHGVREITKGIRHNMTSFALALD